MSQLIDRKFVLETIALVVLAVICATTANAIASRSRKVALVGDYPKALVVPDRQPPSSDPVPDDLTLVPRSNPIPLSTSTASTVPTVPTGPTAPPPSTQSPVVKPAPAKTAPPTQRAPRTVSTSAKVFAPHPDKPWVEVSGDDVQVLHARNVPFFDARRTSVYEDGHIAGARNISVWEADLKEKIQQVYEEGLNPEGPIVVYCSGGDCEDSHMLSEKLWGIGLNNVLVYKDGYPDWLKRGGAVRRGSKP